MGNNLFTGKLMRGLVFFLFLGLTFSAYSQHERVNISKRFLASLTDGDFKEAYGELDQEMAGRISLPQLQSIWNSIQTEYGELVHRQVTQRDTLDAGYRVVIFCAFTKGDIDMQIIFNDENKIEGMFFAPGKFPDSYQPPEYDFTDLYSERDITVRSGDYSLPGTFYYPSAGKNIPVVVLIHGSGGHERYSTFGLNKPFRDIAVGLASFGIGVVCFDKRTYVYPRLSEKIEDFTVYDEIIEDAVSAAELAGNLPETDPGRVFLLGHGFGGMMLPRIADKINGLGGLIKVAANARPFEQVMLEHVKHQARLEGDHEHTKDALKLYKLRVMRVKRGDIEEYSASELPLNLPPSYWMDLNDYDHLEYAAGLEIPALLMHGGRDYSVTETDLEIWKEKLGDKNNVSFRYFPGLNHLFIEGEGKSNPGEYRFPGNVAIDVILDIREWVKNEASSGR